MAWDAPLTLSHLSPCFPAICCAACEQFVGLQPCAGKVIGAAYTLLQSIISLVAPGSHRRLAAAAGTASDAQQCTAVVWGLQVGPLEWAYRGGDAGCPVLSSVCALQCVRSGRFTGSFAWAAGRRKDAHPTGPQANGEQAYAALQHPSHPHAHAQASLGFTLPTLYVWRSQLLAALKYVEDQQPWQRRAEADSALHASAYAWLCSPVLRAAEFCTGEWTLTIVLAALGGFIAGVLWHHQQNS